MHHDKTILDYLHLHISGDIEKILNLPQKLQRFSSHPS